MKKRVVAFRSMTLLASIEVSFTSTVTYSVEIDANYQNLITINPVYAKTIEGA